MSFRATILGLAGLGTVVAAAAAQAEYPAAQEPSAKAVWLKAHNAERAEFGVAPLRWNPALAADAKGWADVLARGNTLRHSPQSVRAGQGENLWMGTRGYYAPEQMLAAFAEEKQYFRSGTFPQVSRTGNWADVGHYTQIVWAETREVGCALSSGQHFDVLVCRYWPAGNVIGTRIAPRVEIAQR
jgi:hypothetical protein